MDIRIRTASAFLYAGLFLRQGAWKASALQRTNAGMLIQRLPGLVRELLSEEHLVDLLELVRLIC